MNERFYRWVEETVKRNGGWRKAAEKAGLVHATLLKAAGRTKTDRMLDLETLMALAKLGNVSLAYVINLYLGQSDDGERLALQAQRLAQEHPELAEVLLAAADMGYDVLRDVLRYARFRIENP